MTKEDTKKLSVEKELEVYKKQGANFLGPSINLKGLSEFHVVVVDTETLSTNPTDGDIYKHKDKFGDRPAQYIISGQGLKKLALSAGVFWDPIQTRATTISQRYVAYNADGYIRKADGTPEGFRGEADVDIDVEEEDLRDKFEDKRKDWLAADSDWFRKMGQDGQDAYIDNKFRKELRFKKKHKTKTAATNAKSRAIRPLLRIKPTYTLAELSKPFVTPRVILQPDYSDPEVKKMMLAASIQAQTNVFGPASIQALPGATIDLPSSEYKIQHASDEGEKPDEGSGDHSDSNDEPSEREIFENLNKTEQIEVLKKKAVTKGYEPKQPIEDLSSDDRLDFFDRLENLEDIPTGNGSDMPF